MGIFYLVLGIVFIIAGVLTLYHFNNAYFREKGIVMSIISLVLGVISVTVNFLTLYPNDREYFFQKYRKQFPEIGIFLLFLLGIIFIRLAL